MKNDPDTTDVMEMLEEGTDNKKYGQVSGSGTASNPSLDIDVVFTESAAGDYVTITWLGLTFTKVGQKFTTTINNVTIQDDGGSVELTTRISESGEVVAEADTLAKSPTLYITDTMDGAVKFTITAKDVTADTFVSFNAAEEVSSIAFNFEAKTTSIKDGQVRFTIPRNWTRPVKPLKDNTVKAHGQLMVADGGTTDDNRVGNVSISGQTVTVKVPELAKDKSITITINSFTDADTGIAKMVTVQSDATEEDEYEAITGYFWTSSPIRGRGHNAGGGGGRDHQCCRRLR